MSRSNAYGLAALLAISVWAGAAISTVIQKLNADKSAKDALSAVQVQQVQGAMAAHALMWLIVGCAATVPLFLIAVSAIISGREEAPTEVGAAES
jgi:hypothetical protein